jgi:hypothetical protein
LRDVNTTVFFAEGFDDTNYAVKRSLSYNNGEFRYDIEGQQGITKNITCKVNNKPSQYVWYIIFMSPLLKDDKGDYNAELRIVESRIVDCIYPEEDLYPEKDFYPIFGNWNKLKEG